MTLIADPGHENANSYATLAEADAFHATRGGDDRWTDRTALQKQGALIRATDFIDANYVFKSVRNTADQPLEAPRYPSADLDARLVKATILLAVHMLDGDANERKDRAVESETKRLEGVGSTSTQYAKKERDPYPLITKTLSAIAKPRSAQVGTIRMVNP